MIKVSVIVPVYNAQKYLSECLDSIRAQVLKDFEVICINDGSTDSSLDILNSYAEKDQRFRIFTKENAGSAAARNVGLRYARGEYIYFVDNDDFIDSEALQACCEVADRYTLDVVYTNPNWVCESPELIDPYSRTKDPTPEQSIIQNGKELFTSLMLGSNYYAAPWKRFIRRSYLEEFGVNFLEEASPHEDNLFSFRVDIEAGKVLFLKRRFYTHRSHGASTMITNEKKLNLGPKIVSHFLCGCRIMQYASGQRYSQDTRMAILRRVNGLWNRAFELFDESDGNLRELDWKNMWLEENLFSQMHRLRSSAHARVAAELSPAVATVQVINERRFLPQLASIMLRIDQYKLRHGWLRLIKRIVTGK